MSNHHTRKAINLHHDQVNAGKARRLQRQADRFSSYLVMSRQLRWKYNVVAIYAFIGFAYTTIATALYLGYVLEPDVTLLVCLSAQV